MNTRHDRFQELERLLSIFVLAAAVLFVGYLVSAACCLSVLKIVLAVLTIVISAFGLWVLIKARELTNPRGLWLTCSFFCIPLCVIVSLICNFP